MGGENLGIFDKVFGSISKDVQDQTLNALRDNEPKQQTVSTTLTTSFDLHDANAVNRWNRTSVEINDLLFGAISKLVNTCSLAELELFKGKSKVNNDLTNFLEFDINEMQTWFDFITLMETQRNVKGNAYALILKSDGNLSSLSNDIKAIIPLNPDSVTPMSGLMNEQEFYEIAGIGKVPTYNVFHVKHMALSGISMNSAGANPIDISKPTTTLDANLNKHSVSVLSQALYSFIINTGDITISDDEYNALVGAITGFNNGNSTVLNDLEIPIEATKNSFNLQELDSTESKIQKRLGSIYGVPMQLIGASYDYNGIMESLRYLISSIIPPILKKYASELNKKVLTPKQREEGYRFRFNTFPLYESDLKLMMEFFHTSLRDGYITRSEVRGKLGFDPIGGNADILMISSDMVPLDMDPADRRKTNGTSTELKKEPEVD